jgi:TolA-binding protein
MKFRIASLTILSVLLGASVFVCAQDEKQQDTKQQADSPKQDEAKPAQQDNAKPAKQQDDEMKQNEAKPSKQEKQDEKQQEKQEKQNNKQMQQEQGGSGQAAPENQQRMQDHGSAQQPGQPAAAQGGNAQGRGGHIPDNQFRAHFGRSHSFRAQTVIVSGQPQFQYSGYTFELVDAWPAGWVYTDDCYIDYIDGEYFLFDLLHPGIRIAVFVVM